MIDSSAGAISLLLTFLALLLFLWLLPNRHQPSHNQIFGLKLLLPPSERLLFLRSKILQLVQRSIQVLGQHLIIKALHTQPPRRITTRKVLVRRTGTVELPAVGDVEHAPAHRKEDARLVAAVVREEGARGEGAEDDGGGFFGEGGCGCRFEGGVEAVEEDGEEEDVEWGDERVGIGVSGERYLVLVVFADQR